MAEETKARVERLVRLEPTMSAQEIADTLGVSRQRVSKILKGLGYKLEWKKQKE